MGLNIFKTNIVSNFEKENIVSIQFDWKAINKKFSTKVCINFFTQAINIFSKI